jgi:hypothetical protein
LDKIYTIFLEARHHRADQNSKIIAIEPMNRQFVHFARQKRSEVSKPSETITIQVMSISGMRECRISLIVCVSKRVLFGID